MNDDTKLFKHTILIPHHIMYKLKWENGDVLRMTVEDDEFLIIGKTKTHDEVIESIQKITNDTYNPKEYWKSFWEEQTKDIQQKRPIHDKIIQDTLKILIGEIEWLDKRLSELEGK